MSLLGVDVGTSGLKAVAVRADDGRSIAAATRSYAAMHPAPGWMELDPESVWQAYVDAVRDVASAPAVRHDPVTAMALSVSCDEVLPIGGDGMPLAACIMGPDTRGADVLGEVASLLPEREAYVRTGLPLAPIHPIARIAWYRRYQPAVADQARHWLGWGEFLLARLGLPPTSDETTAGRWLAFDVLERTWMPEVLRPLDLEGRIPAVRAPGTPIDILGRGARVIGLPSDVLVVAGAFDQLCAAIGAGLREPGHVVVGSGTWENTTIILDGPLGEAACARGITWGRYVDHRFAGLVMNPGGGSIIRWLADALGGGEATEAGGPSSIAHAVEAIMEQDRGPGRVLFLPHLAGSLAPHRDPRSTGAFVGLTFATGRSDLARAALEGMAYELRLNLEPVEGVPPLRMPIRNTGGGSRSMAWVQLKADVLGRPMATMREPEPGCLGAAILAGFGVGALPNIATVQDAWCVPARIVEPDPAAHERHDERLMLYRELYPALRRISAAL